MRADGRLLTEIERARDDLYALLRSKSPDSLAQRPVPGEWSVVENVRHLIFAEQLHLGRPLLGRFTWSGVGLRTDGRSRPPEVGLQPTDDIEKVLAAWDAVHGPIRDAARSADGVDAALERNLRHLRSHIRTIERLLGKLSTARGGRDGRRTGSPDSSRSG